MCLAQLKFPQLIFEQKRRIRELSALESEILNTLHGTKVCILWYYAKQSTKKMLCFNVILIFEPRKAEKVGGGKAAKRDAEVAAISPCHRCCRATGL